MNYLVVTIKSWDIDNFEKLKRKDNKNNWFLITDKKHFTYKRVKKINPEYIFIPHWSWVIPENIWSNFNCIVFHITDLPYGRGGSPLQNLIVRGHKHTKISALKVNQGLDTGGIYLKRNLSLSGSATQIFEKFSATVFDKMIPCIIKRNPVARSQTGKAVVFKRRKPHQSKITPSLSIDKTYDLIRMLDAEGYPQGYLETKKLKFNFFQIKKLKNNSLEAKVKIYEK